MGNFKDELAHVSCFTDEEIETTCLGPYVFVVVQLLSRVQFFMTPYIAARQSSLSFTISQSLLRFMFIESVMPSNRVILCHPSD